ncbi:ribosome maturation factor RimM [Xylocopilactobacillus apicola]|uniref:Ribosome maturation factor RimM n=1 Tax=Xylocopilactobacillus apicola TaxID=2932184 RepID=A0AAU9DQL9_9LACO|nr:ribosome maturation factor RimM [Xylocopilactobacillus apicola]BDR58189.1 ribosome maturation factor RimM [Xylocopilactobacillus apicola]
MDKQPVRFQVGIIVKTRGLKGEVKVKSTTDFPSRFQVGAKLLTDKGTLKVAKSREQQGFWFITFEGYEDINAVEPLIGQNLYVNERHDQLAPDEFYVSDLLGLPVFTQSQEEVGRLKDVLHYGPNDVWVVKTLKDRELLLPYLPDFIKKVDLENQKIIVDLTLCTNEN